MRWSALWEAADMIPSKEEMLLALTERNGQKLQDRFSRGTVAVCGLGGLGSNIAISLARTGIGKLIIIDFDRVDITNLNRQQYKVGQIGRYKTDALEENLKEIAPYVEIQSHTVRIDQSNALDLLRDASIICEAFDNPECKSMLTDIVLEKMPDKFLVAASGMAGMGNPNSIKTRKITDKFYLCGDGVSDISDGIGLVAPRVAICAAHQAHTVLRILAKEFDV